MITTALVAGPGGCHALTDTRTGLVLDGAALFLGFFLASGDSLIASFSNGAIDFRGSSHVGFQPGLYFFPLGVTGCAGQAIIESVLLFCVALGHALSTIGVNL